MTSLAAPGRLQNITEYWTKVYITGSAENPRQIIRPLLCARSQSTIYAMIFQFSDARFAWLHHLMGFLFIATITKKVGFCNFCKKSKLSELNMIKTHYWQAANTLNYACHLTNTYQWVKRLRKFLTDWGEANKTQTYNICNSLSRRQMTQNKMMPTYVAQVHDIIAYILGAKKLVSGNRLNGIFAAQRRGSF